MRLRGWLLAALAIALGAGGLLSLAQADRFIHEIHFGLFPTCLGCHAGIPEGDEARYYTVMPADCANCHDGERQDPVDWQEPAREPDNLVFSHVVHAEGAGEMECGECHRTEDGEERMEVGRARVELCMDCHEGDPEAHLSRGVDCTECHAALVDATGLSEDRIMDFPWLSSHDESDFILSHGEGVRRWGGTETCAVCHARESCTRCHLNAADVPSIQMLGSDPRIAAINKGEDGEWPVPESHEQADWALAHGSAATEAPAGCANCHAAPTCQQCHGAVRLPALAGLPTPRPGGPRGAMIRAFEVPGHGGAFGSQHGTAAVTGLPKCESCHVETQCAACHEQRNAGPSAMGDPADASSGAGPDDALAIVQSLPGERRSGYHPANFVLRHGAEAYSAQSTCSDCHTTEVFCRDCHQTSGFGASRVRRGGLLFHDAQPDWLLNHGQAARQGLEECASCHQQTTCLRCHSAKTPLWNVNPHGADFDAERIANKSPEYCIICHFASILDVRDPD